MQEKKIIVAALVHLENIPSQAIIPVLLLRPRHVLKRCSTCSVWIVSKGGGQGGEDDFAWSNKTPEFSEELRSTYADVMWNRLARYPTGSQSICKQGFWDEEGIMADNGFKKYTVQQQLFLPVPNVN